jgi:hypothetical protein
VLVVAAFDRLDVGTLLWEDIDFSGLGEVVRMDLRRMNAYDVVVAHGEAISAHGWPFDAASDEALDGLDLSRYRLIVWAAGEESTVDESFSSGQQDTLRTFVEAGGALFASGAEILWDLDEKGSSDDRAFAEDVLGATMEEDSSGTTDADGEGLLAGVGPLDFAESDGAPYPVEYPDVLATDRDPVVRYATGGTAGALGDGVFLLGFPFETIGDVDVRAEVAGRVLDALVPDYVPPDPGGETGDSGDTDTGSGPGDTSSPDTDGGGPGDRFLRQATGCGCSSNPAPLRGLPLLMALMLVRRRSRGA